MHVLAILLIIVEVVVCLLLVGLVLIQRSKGDGISAAFGGGMGESIFGAQVGNVVTRTTVVLGIVFLLNTICLTRLLTATAGRGSDSVMAEKVKAPEAAPAAPALPSPELPASMPGSAKP